MRDVDTDALREIAGTLQIGNPVTAVEQVAFDDALLQQVYDVGGALPGYGPESGWFGATQDHIHTGTGTLRNTLDVYQRVAELGFQANELRCDVWHFGTFAESEQVAGSTIDLVLAGIHIPAIANSAFPTQDHIWMVNRTTAFNGTALILNGTLQGNAGQGPIATPLTGPILIPHQAAGIAMASTATHGGTNIRARCIHVLWAGPRGHRPPRCR